MSKTIKDLCFLIGVLCPILALILCFCVKNEEYKKSFRASIAYGFILWAVFILIITMNMCDAHIYGASG